MSEKDLNYLVNLHQVLKENDTIEQLREYAEAHQVPIVHPLTLDMIKQLIRMKDVRSVLEIGTAIGYSSMQFASVKSGIHVTTVERNPDMIQRAKENIQHYRYEDNITLVEGDASERHDAIFNQTYDMLFIDAAKAQSKRFFEMYAPLVKPGGLILTDNVLYHGFVADIDVVRSRNVKQMVKKVQKYNEWLIQLEGYHTNFLDIEDGLAITIKGE
ncbi:class I SAM-dependent methyltransferase [Staphylococcus massiliensis]|uniref:class I SAM-dependent methyltransferase n=1 Tax=Staphylococcus massiliensis TaxID=555791 RepID=UPI0002D98B0E|nr:O-methyltransferase [Staphylococcus massiliensis]MCG3399053.1 O-methyltransferase [Staphylococcus massiliensis]MCG3400949.1 O-methyltransferase [Staphylococcus massiliensis]MCG3412485.1 O-methyltransferase [Staphylococcus massiliensis]PNZ98948.1 O-methyltransferase [Staphylococcus massiliensis CCUG 55927]